MPLPDPRPSAGVGATNRGPRSRSRRYSKQRGAIVVWFALFMMSMLSFAALGIDVAKLAATRTQLQNAADAAALAGASAVDPVTGRINVERAVARAQEVAAKNEAFVDAAQPVTVDPGDVEVLTDNQVRVTVRRQGANSVVTSMARVLGIKSLEIMASAVAQADTAQAVCTTVPLGIMPEPAGQPLQVGCGHTYVFKLGSAQGSNGSYRPLMLPPCQDGPCAGMDPDSPQTFECLMKSSYRCCVSYKEWIFLERGQWQGPLRKSIDDRIDNDTDKREGICYDEYHGNGSRIMFVPITSPEVRGDSGVWVNGMAAFFVKGRVGAGQGAALAGEFINAVVQGVPGGSEGIGPIAYTLHLVKNSTR